MSGAPRAGQRVSTATTDPSASPATRDTADDGRNEQAVTTDAVSHVRSASCAHVSGSHSTSFPLKPGLALGASDTTNLELAEAGAAGDAAESVSWPEEEESGESRPTTRFSSRSTIGSAPECTTTPVRGKGTIN